jgi:hypothetical protein
MSGQLSEHYGAMHRYLCASCFDTCLNTRQLQFETHQKQEDGQLIVYDPVNLYELANFRRPISKNLTSKYQKFYYWLKTLMFLLQSFTIGLRACYTLFLYKFKVCLSFPDSRLFSMVQPLALFQPVALLRIFIFYATGFFRRIPIN